MHPSETWFYGRVKHSVVVGYLRGLVAVSWVQRGRICTRPGRPRPSGADVRPPADSAVAPGLTPIFRNSFRTYVWLPAVAASGVDFAVRVHDLATRTHPGCSDLKSVTDSMGHAQIQTTQRHLRALPDADQRPLNALERVMRRA